MSSRRAPSPRVVSVATGAGLCVLALAVPQVATTSATLTDSATVGGNVVSTRSACAAGAPYAQAVQLLSPTFYWRIGERTPPAVTSVADSTTNNLPGTVQGTGLTFGTGSAGLVQCDNTYSVRFPGNAASRQFLVRSTAVANTNTFTISAWIRSNSTRGGWVLGMGGSRWGTSTNYDRVLYLQRNGRPSFSVGIGPRTTIFGTTAVNDNQPHHLVATLSGAGMALYVDGVLVASNGSVTSGAHYTGNGPADPTPPANPDTPNGFGYWRVGYDATTGLGPVTPTRSQLRGQIDEIAVWQSTALTADAVAGLYAGDHW